MIPFWVSLKPGTPVYEQVVLAVKRAVVSGLMRPGEAFPSVRTLSRELKINPNTAQKVITQLTKEGMLEVNVGVGTVVSNRGQPNEHERAFLLNSQLEELIVEAKRLGIAREDLIAAVRKHWQDLAPQARERA